MATERTTRNQRRLLVGLLGVTAGLAVVLGLALGAGGKDGASSSGASRPATTSSDTVRSRPASASSEPVASRPADGRRTTSIPTTTQAPVAPETSAADTSVVVATDDAEQPMVGTTQACRADPTCPSSEHRTSDLCGAALIVDLDGYLEGRHDAEQGRPYQIDGAPAPTPADDDDDDGTVGPQTLYRAGYVQGWCDGGGEQPASR
jgi:hypothetical protein